MRQKHIWESYQEMYPQIQEDWISEEEFILDTLLEEGIIDEDMIIDILEMRKVDKMAGKQSGGNPNQAYRSVKKMIRGMEGRPAGQRKRAPGSPIKQPESPVSKFKRQREIAKNRPDPYRPRAGESD